MTTSPMTEEKLPLEGAARGTVINPAWFVPVLYVMQGMPVTTVQEMFSVTWKDLHVSNPVIVSWISILSLPWSFKHLYVADGGHHVDQAAMDGGDGVASDSGVLRRRVGDHVAAIER